MRNRSGIQGVASSPVIVGAVTVLVVIVAVFLAYNANNGLPFVSTYDLKARVPNAQRAGQRQRGADRRLAGRRRQVGQAGRSSATATSPPNSSLSLDKSAEPIPVNSTMIIRPKSPLGLKYLQIVPGDSSQGLRGRAKRSRSPRPGPNRSTSTSSSTCSTKRRGRDPAQPGRLRQRLRRPRPAAERRLRRPAASWPKAASPCCARSSRPSTNFGGFWRALEDLSATVAPVAETQRRACSSPSTAPSPPSPASRGRSSRKRSPRARRPSTRSTADLPALRPFLHDSARFFTALQARRQGARPKPRRRSTRRCAPASRRSTARRPSTPSSSRPRKPCSPSRKRPGVFNGLDLLIDTNELLEPAIKFIAPAQTTCNYLTPRLPQPRRRASAKRNGDGNWLGAIAFEPPDGPNAEGGARLGAGQRPRSATTTSTSTPTRTPPRPARRGECEAGNERYAPGKTVIGNVAGNSGARAPPNEEGEG